LIHGESGSAPVESLDVQREKIREILKNYDLSEIYNADETGLFFRMVPQRTISSQNVAGKKKVKIKLFQ
jgi:hypothetical protein